MSDTPKPPLGIAVDPMPPFAFGRRLVYRWENKHGEIQVAGFGSLGPETPLLIAEKLREMATQIARSELAIDYEIRGTAFTPRIYVHGKTYGV